MNNANTFITCAAALVLIQFSGLAFLFHQQQTQAEALASLKLAFETEIRAREALQTEVSAIKAPMASEEKPPATGIDAIFGDVSAAPSPEVEQKLDALKKQYEDVLVLHFFLAKCGKSTVQDFHTINSNLSQDMASVNAPGRLQYDIMTAAKGSYDAIYAKTPCEGEQAEASEKAFRQYINQLTNRSNVP